MVMDDLEGLDPRLLETLSELGISQFTEPQQRSIPLIAKGRNVLLVAPTGIGKTEAALLPIMDKILRERPAKIHALYITPLRALNRDMLRRMEFFGEKLGIDVAVRHGDTSQRERARQSRNPPEILITTPETFQIMFTGRRLREHLMNVESVVVDEIHDLADNERGYQLSIGLERLVHLAGKEHQRIGLSATVGSPEEVGRFLVGTDRDVEIVRVSVPKDMKISVEHPEWADEDEKSCEELRLSKEHAPALRRSRELVRSHTSTLFFVNTRDTAEFLASRFAVFDPDLDIGVHHGSLSKEIRIQAEDRFKQQEMKGLICTSSLELGIDVGSADYVIQYSSPRQVTRLIQRIGRSGHGVGEVSDGRIIAVDPDDFAEASVIARKALNEELEEVRIRENDMAVLANQIIAFSMTLPRCGVDEAYEVVRRAYPYRNLNRNDFLALLEQLRELRKIWLRDGYFGRSRESLVYFYENISMIPDVKTYRVKDIATRRTIGTLDEWFVVEHAKLGTNFVMRGKTWRFVDFKDGNLMVEPIAEIGDVPSWLGEDIPVPFKVAQEVGKLRKTVDFNGYPANKWGIKRFREYIEKQSPAPIPSDDVVTIDVGDKSIIINACFGSRVNETLGQLISSLLTARLSEEVQLKTDPYRIMLGLPLRIDPERVKKILFPQDTSGLRPLLRLLVKNSARFRWIFVHTAKKFGAIRRDVDWETISVSRIMRAFEGTPLMHEAVEKVLWDRMDIERTIDVMERIREGRIRVLITEISPIGLAGLKWSRGFLAPGLVDLESLRALKRRIEGMPVLLLCLNCKKSRRSRVGSVGDRVVCPLCGGVMIAALHTSQREKEELLKKERISKEERREIRRIYTNANLVMTYGKRAILALMARGIGPTTAARILRKAHSDENSFLKDILEAEVTYARTKRFWD